MDSDSGTATRSLGNRDGDSDTITWIGIERQGQVVRLRDIIGTGQQEQSDRNGDRDRDRDGGTGIEKQEPQLH